MARNLRRAGGRHWPGRSVRLVCGALLAVAAFPSAARELPEGTDLSVYEGEAGWRVIPETTRLLAQRAQPGEAIAEQRVTYRRTGTLRESVVYAVKSTVPAGSVVYAVWLREAGTGWCAPGVLDSDGRIASQKRKVETCFFLDRSDNEPFQTQSHKGKSAFHSPVTTGGYRVRTPVLVDEAQGVFDQRMKVSLRLGKARRGQLAYEFVFTDAFGSSRLLKDTVERAEDGAWTIPLWGGAVRVRPDGTGYAVSEATPLRDELGEDPRLRGARTKTITTQIIWF